MLLLVALVTGCQARPEAAAALSGQPRSLLLAPESVVIPKVGVNASLGELGLEPDGSLQVPADPMQPGWYVNSPVPGDLGPAVIVGHRDSADNPRGIFRRLAKLRPGDQILIRRSDGRTVTFRVDRLQTVRKDEFPTDLVYGNTDGPALRLITCGGALVDGHWRDNVIVFASLPQPA